MKKFGFGCMRLPLKGSQEEIDYDELKKMFDHFMANGYTYFDTAYFYHGGKSEVAVKDCLVSRYPRDSFTIATKMPVRICNTEEDVDRYFNEQLERTGAGYFDYYLLHALDRDRMPTVKDLHIYEYVKAKKEAGLIKHLGFSFHDTADILENILTEYPDFEFVQLQLNYLDWKSPNVQAEKCYEVCVKHGKPVVVMEPVKGGKLADVPEEALANFKAYAPDATPASWAIKFAADLDNVMVVLSGMSNLEQVEDNIKTMNGFTSLNDEEKAILDKNAEIIRAANPIPCTACRYCVDGCPMNIAIPEYFDLANDKRPKLWEYDRLVALGHGKASDCIKCGQCENACPQHLPITEYLENICVKVFETERQEGF